MSTIDPAEPSITPATPSSELIVSAIELQPNGSSPLPLLPFKQEVKRQINELSIATLRPLLIIIRITIIFLFALFADDFIITIINWSFGNIFAHNAFAGLILDGIQLLSALGTAIAYIFYLISSLIKDAKLTMHELQAKSGEEVK